MSSNNPISLRLATQADEAFIHQCNNQPEVRAVSKDSSDIPWEAHQIWFAQRLTDPESTLWIIEESGSSVGVIRFRRQTSLRLSEISIALLSSVRGRGVGRAAIDLACRQHISLFPEYPVEAWILETNTASVRCFQACGFVKSGQCDINSHRFEVWRWPF